LSNEKVNKTISAIGGLNIDLFQARLKYMKNIDNDPYINVYPSLIESIARQKEDIHSLIAISHIAYGWMPTIITSRFKDEDSFLWDKVKTGSLEEFFLERMKECVNNSIVGASKFLHFRNPKRYAIWDSRVYRSITNNKMNQNQINNIENFIYYTKRMREIAKNEIVKSIKKSLIERGYCNDEASNLRALELILFYTSTPE
jgi:hypothetical protein